MTLAQLRTALQARGYGTDTAAVQTECINAAYREIVGDHHWSWLEDYAESAAMVPGDMILTGLPADLLHIRSVHLHFAPAGTNTELYNMTHLSALDFANRANDAGWALPGAARSVPEYWTVDPTTAGTTRIAVGPAPDRAYVAEIRYTADPTDLSADGDIPVLPAAYHDVIVSGALAEMGARHRDWAMADRYRARFDRGLSRMKAQLGIAQQQTSVQVTKSGFFDTPVRWPE